MRRLLFLAVFSLLTHVSGGEFPGKVLFLGNSITKHGPKADIDWAGNWGMAASAEDKDYVHLVVDALTKKAGKAPEFLVKNIADFERSYTGYDFATKQSEALAFKADLIILAIGENVPALKDDAAQMAFQESLVQMLKALQGDHHPTVLVRSCFWANARKDAALRGACDAVGGIFVDISTLGKDEANYARSERPFKHAGVANHPGDKGMAAIASAIVAAVPAEGR